MCRFCLLSGLRIRIGKSCHDRALNLLAVEKLHSVVSHVKGFGSIFIRVNLNCWDNSICPCCYLLARIESDPKFRQMFQKT